MTPEQLQDAVLGNYLAGAIGILLVVLVVSGIAQEIWRERRSSRIDDEILAEGSLARVMRKRWKV